MLALPSRELHENIQSKPTTWPMVRIPAVSRKCPPPTCVWRTSVSRDNPRPAIRAILQRCARALAHRYAKTIATNLDTRWTRDQYLPVYIKKIVCNLSCILPTLFRHTDVMLFICILMSFRYFITVTSDLSWLRVDILLPVLQTSRYDLLGL